MGKKAMNRLDLSLRALLTRQFFEFMPYYLGAVLCLYLTHFCQSYIPFLAQGLGELAQKGDLHQAPLSIYFLLAVSVIVFRTSSRLLFFYPARLLQKFLKNEMLGRLEVASPYRYSTYNSGQLFQVLQNDFDQMRALIGFAILQVGNVIIAMLVMIPKISKFHPQLLMAFLPLCLGVIIFGLMVMKVQNLYRKSQDLQGEVQNHIIESYEGKRSIKNFHAEKSFLSLFQLHTSKELQVFYKASQGTSMAQPLINLSVGLSLVWGAYVVEFQMLGRSTLILFSGFIFLLKEPLMFLSWIGIIFSRSIGSWKRIKDLVSRLAIVTDQEKELQKLNPFLPAIHNQDSQNSMSKKLILPFWGRDLRIDLVKSEWNIFIGRTGCGKSTMLRMMADIFKQHGLSHSLVGQDPYLYNDTVLNNIFLGRVPDEVDREKAKNYLKIFSLDHLAQSADEVLNMEIGENGDRISGGQGKRLCLIRSLMSEGQVLLWDDPFSSVDVLLEKDIIKTLREIPEVKEKFFILSSHRLSTVKFCDQIFFLEKNEGIIECGKAKELLVSVKSKTYEYFQKQVV